MAYTLNGYLPKQGDIVWFNSNPTSGREINKHRPCLILSSTAFNSQTGFMVVAPITSTEKKHLVALPDSYSTKGYVNYIHLKSIDFTAKERQVRFIESVSLFFLGKVVQRVETIFNFTKMLGD